MREKILSLAKGKFTYVAPKLVLPAALTFSVVSGKRKKYSFHVSNAAKTRFKGFGVVNDVHIDFLPFFEGVDNELSLEVNAEELQPGEHLKGDILLITECGEERIPYDISVTTPELFDEKGPVRDYHTLQERIRDNPEHGVQLFLSEEFQDAFLYRDENSRILYDYLTKKNTKMQGMEEFLVATKKKKPIRFEVRHENGTDISYELDGADIEDTISVCVNTWGHTGISVSSDVNFIEPHTPMLWTDEFKNGKDILEYTIVADKIPCGRKSGNLIFQTPYEKKTIQIHVHNPKGEQERKIERAKKAVIATMVRMYLAHEEKRITRHDFQKFLRKNQEVLEKVSGRYTLVVKGYISIILNKEEWILSFFQEAEKLSIPPLNTSVDEVENYIAIEFIKTLYTNRQEERERLTKLIDGYEENGYQTDWITYIRTQVDERYRSLRLLEKDVRARIEGGSNSPFLYSVLMRAYQEDSTLIVALDSVTMDTINYGLKQGLTTREIAMAVSFLGERLSYFEPKVLWALEKLYDFYAMTDTLRGICSLLIRNEICERKYFHWFEKGVEQHLRLTDLFEYYMDTIDYGSDIRLPDSVLSYFQYENRLNATRKAFLYAYLIRHKQQQPDFYQEYQEQISEFAHRQLARHKISPDLSVIYLDVFQESAMHGDVAKDLSSIMFTYGLWCEDSMMDGVVVVHRECQGETFYSLENGYTQVQIYTPNAQIYFVDEHGRYYAGTVDYRIEPMIQLDEYAWRYYEEGADGYPLLLHLVGKAEKAPRMNEQQAKLLYYVMDKKILREHMHHKVLFRLYDYYCDTKNDSLLLEVLKRMDVSQIRKERLGSVATQCIYHELYEKAAEILCRDGVLQCEAQALAILVAELIGKCEGQFEPLLVKWALHLYQEKHYDKVVMGYLLQYFMGDVHTLHAIYVKCKQISEMENWEENTERLLAQILFVGEELLPYEKIYLTYYEEGKNRMLVKAYLAELAYEYVVEETELPESLFVKIEKEAMYEKDLVMVLATLRYYREQKTFAAKQKEFIELNLERYASEGLVLAFMKDYIGKVNVPYEIENRVLVQFYSGTEGRVFLCEQKENGEVDSQPMRQVFPGVFTRELLLFANEEKRCYIYEEETDEKTETMTVSRPQQIGQTPSFFKMVNDMIQAEQEDDRQTYQKLQMEYEKARHAAGKLFTVL